ncbi:MAG: hypothetical protein K6T16_00075 [Candidatus Pacearchaeota archaeon]|nr:hypothetical protein [Candidatus Pacearchaeota archaeon]
MKVEILEERLNRAILINGHLFREDLTGWIYVGRMVSKPHKNRDKGGNGAVALYNKLFEIKPTHLDIGIGEKNFYPHRILPTEVNQRLGELYTLCKNRKKVA